MTAKRMTALTIAQIGIMSATLSAGKTALAFMPNIEIVSLLIILYSIYFGKKVILAVYIFIAVECMIWGINIWTLMYIYIWPALSLVSVIFRKKDSDTTKIKLDIAFVFCYMYNVVVIKNTVL